MPLNVFVIIGKIFVITGVRPDGISLPRQHSIFHYPSHIENFASPGGVCTSMSESKHIVAVKKPYRRSNKHNALFQILLTNERNDSSQPLASISWLEGCWKEVASKEAHHRYLLSRMYPASVCDLI